MSDVEIWRPVTRLPEYQASSFGRLMRIPHEAPMPHGGTRTYGGTPTYGAWDHVTVRYLLQYKGKTHRVAVLVCEAFHGEKPFPTAVAMHLDEDSTNNCPDNLRWGTQKENMNFPLFRQRRSVLSRRVTDNG